MNPWPFVFSAYALTFGSVAVLIIVSWRAMRRAEAAAEAMKR